MGNQCCKSEVSRDSRFLYGIGQNDNNEVGEAPGTPLLLTRTIIAVSSGSNHTIALLTSGDLLSFGLNEYRQLGTSFTSLIRKRDYRIYPTLPKSFTCKVVAVAAGGFHSACVTIDGLVFTWGQGTEGQLGYSVTSHGCIKDPCSRHRYSPTPRLVESLSKVKKVACGSDFTLALTVEGKILSFGNGVCGVLGNGKRTCCYTPQHIEEVNNVTDIECGRGHCLALTNLGKVYFWGNPYREMYSELPNVNFPLLMEGLEHLKIAQIACGGYHCAVLTNMPGCVLTWGNNSHGQLGHGECEPEFPNIMQKPKQIYIEKSVKTIKCGAFFSVAGLKNGSVLGWGDNSEGQLGNFDPTLYSPVQIHDRVSGRVSELECGDWFTLFLTRKGIKLQSAPEEVIVQNIEEEEKVLVDLEGP